MATPEDARRANRSLLLGTLHRDGPLSRADLAKQTGLTRATVSAVVRDLIDESVVEELGVRAAGGVGKPATLVGINADGRHVVCLDASEPSIPTTIFCTSWTIDRAAGVGLVSVR